MASMPSPPVVLLSLLALAGSGCVGHRGHRLPGAEVATSIEELAHAGKARLAEVEAHGVERHDEFALAFVEVDDQGELWDPRQADAAVALVEGAKADGALVVVFVHGWKHDARVCDENVACFREILRSLENQERLLADANLVRPRQIVGVYVGWRGLSVSAPLVKETTFWSRKATAGRVGSGDLLSLFTRLEIARDALRQAGAARSRLVLIGHSFGGAVVFNALRGVFEERLTRADALDQPRVRGFGDLVLLVNPAFEAQLYASLHQLGQQTGPYADHQTPVLVTVSSESDAATRVAFPLGRYLPTLFDRTHADQKKALRTTLGNYEAFRTHHLTSLPATTADQGIATLDDLDVTSEGKAGCRCSYIETVEHPKAGATTQALAAANSPPRTYDGIYGQTQLQRTTQNGDPLNPLLVIAAGADVVTEHNGIYNQNFVNFLRELLLAMERRARPSEPSEAPR